MDIEKLAKFLSNFNVSDVNYLGEELTHLLNIKKEFYKTCKFQPGMKVKIAEVSDNWQFGPHRFLKKGQKTTVSFIKWIPGPLGIPGVDSVDSNAGYWQIWIEDPNATSVYTVGGYDSFSIDPQYLEIIK